MQIMTLVFSHLLLFLAFGLCLNSTDAQDLLDTNTTDTSVNNVTMEETTESTSAAPVNINTELQSVGLPNTDFPQTTMVYQLSTIREEPTTVNTTPLKPETVETTPETASETTTTMMMTEAQTEQMPQTEQTTMPSTTMLNFEETTFQQIVPDEPSTNPYETTVDFTSPTEGITTVGVVHPVNEITTVAVEHTTEDITTNAVVDPGEEITTEADTMDSTEVPTSIMPDPVYTDPMMSTMSVSEYDPETTTMIDEEPVSNNSISGVYVDNSHDPSDINWLLIIGVCGVAIFALCVGMIAIVLRRKKKASGSFGPAYMNGSSKRSKKKKGAEKDAWAGPVNLEAGPECDAEVQEGLLPNDGKLDGDDVVLSTFAALDEVLDMSDGGVGGEGTKEAQKWEEKEPMPYIDEDVDENKPGKTVVANEKMNGVEKCEEKELNGGEAFCITTAV